MKFAVLKSTDPYLNLAIEEYLFRYTTDDIFMLWQNEPSVVVGVNQNIYAEIDFDYLRSNNIHPVRRITGGGAVYHDLGNVNYTYISQSKSANEIDFISYTKPIVDALKALSINATLNGRNDLYVDGFKFSGNAQHHEGSRVLHHGTILFDADFQALSSALTVDEEKLKSKAVKSVRNRVVNLSSYLNGISVNNFIKHILIANHIQINDYLNPSINICYIICLLCNICIFCIFEFLSRKANCNIFVCISYACIYYKCNIMTTSTWI